MKSKQRSKMQPKMGKLGMDYQMMHEAFFKYQSKPRMSRVGDLYYEGKEFEAKARSACVCRTAACCCLQRPTCRWRLPVPEPRPGGGRPS